MKMLDKGLSNSHRFPDGGGQKVQGFVRRKLARDGARGFGFGIGCSGVILMTRDGCRQVGIGEQG